MGRVINPGAHLIDFFWDAKIDGYAMGESFIDPSVGEDISGELATAGFLVDYTELMPTDLFQATGMRVAGLLHGKLNEVLCNIEGTSKNHIPLFSVRVFGPGQYGTTVHRNHPSVGPWAVGVTLKGEAPFNVYADDQLSGFETIPLMGDETDPEPLDSMTAGAGSLWTLYTRNELVPHSSGLVNSQTQRELLIFYATANYGSTS
jgi:hypothetical protein